MERLTFAVSSIEGRTLSGVAHVYGQVTVDGRQHSFAPGAFSKSLAAQRPVSFAYHDTSKPLASVKAGTLKLADSDAGLTFALELPEGVSYAEDLKRYKEAGNDLYMSFAVVPGKYSRTPGGGRLFTEADLLSVDPVVQPAFEGTSVVLNSAQAAVANSRSTAIKIRAKVRHR